MFTLSVPQTLYEFLVLCVKLEAESWVFPYEFAFSKGILEE